MPDASGATVQVTQRSIPAGIVDLSMMVDTPTNFMTVSAPMEASSLRFTHWTVNGARSNDAFGRAVNPAWFEVHESVDAVAHYMEAPVDSDADGVPDWFEVHFFDSLTNTASSDADADGWSLLEEYRRDGHPRISNSFYSGGISMRHSEPVCVNLAELFSWSVASDPGGLIPSRSGLATNGVMITATSHWREISGYCFGYWTLNGARQADALGTALSRLTFTVTTSMTAVAHYVPPTQDTDGDGLPDWWESRFLGRFDYGPNADPDSDGFGLLQEFRWELHPVVSNAFLPGGVSMRNSEQVPVVRADPLADVDGDGLPNWWEEQYFGGPTNATPLADSDYDGLPNQDEMAAGTDPTSRLSCLQLEGSVLPDAVDGFVIRWQSVTGRTYSIQRGTNLMWRSSISLIADGICGQPDFTSHTDTTAETEGPYFYSIGIEAP
ncbi:MAG TPA: thrombospondin type 3 repeat-containing protein [Kiritimatiellia bacterium]|nr:thrombospondin type 3 repeat-containing protein [Kiritimatiellia bacterium]